MSQKRPSHNPACDRVALLTALSWFWASSKWARHTHGGPEGTRTPDLRFRKALLYPAELPGRVARAWGA
jgi:hypothetical protein